MTNVGFNIMQLEDQEYNSYLERCDRVTALLDQAINHLMHYIFEGHSSNGQEWESLFTALNQAVFMKSYLKMNCSNLLSIADDFLEQVEAWREEVRTRLN